MLEGFLGFRVYESSLVLATFDDGLSKQMVCDGSCRIEIRRELEEWKLPVKFVGADVLEGFRV